MRNFYEKSAIKAQTSIGDLEQNSGLTIAGTISNVVGNEFILDDGTGEIIVDPRDCLQKKFRLSKITVIYLTLIFLILLENKAYLVV